MENSVYSFCIIEMTGFCRSNQEFEQVPWLAKINHTKLINHAGRCLSQSEQDIPSAFSVFGPQECNRILLFQQYRRFITAYRGQKHGFECKSTFFQYRNQPRHVQWGDTGGQNHIQRIGCPIFYMVCQIKSSFICFKNLKAILCAFSSSLYFCPETLSTPDNAGKRPIPNNAHHLGRRHGPIVQNYGDIV